MARFNPFKKKCVLRITHKYDTVQTKTMQKGDIVLCRAFGKKILPTLISEFTRSPYSHVEIYVGDGWSVSAEAVGVTLADHLNHEFVDVMRLRGGLTREQRAIVMEKAYQSLAQPYEYLLLFGFPFWGRKAAARRAANEGYICSENTAWCYKEAGIDLVPGKVESIEAPADISHSDKLEWLGAWYKGEPAADAHHNDRHQLQGKPSCLARLMIRTIADPNSMRDEYYEALRKKQAELLANS